MHRSIPFLASFSLFLALPARADAARDGSTVVARQQASGRETPTPNAAPPERLEPVRFTDRPLSVNLMLGAGTPVGGFGGLVEYSLARRVALGAGVGATWIDGDRDTLPGFLQLGAVGRFRPWLSEGKKAAEALDVVAGFSTGRFTYPILPGNDASSVRERAYWVQLGVDYELVTRGGFRFAGGIGAAILAATSDVKDVFSDAGPLDRSALPRVFLAVDLSVGYAL